ncbi:MAG: ADP-forming succinate--CoA ligase subunit beta, partial [Asgard group archaeon]|nr:ADP-forming succinate--CoA ligase subunit beta [Asgard group archaeon]
GLILEMEGKELFTKYGIPLSKSKLVKNEKDAKLAAEELGLPVAIKAQVLSGGRGKRGLIKIAKSQEEVVNFSLDILKMTDTKSNKPVTHLLIEEAANIQQEIFISMIFDSHTLETLVLFSMEGGVDIEELAETNPDAIETIRVPFGKDVYGYTFMNILAKRGMKGTNKIVTANIIATMVKMMRLEDLSLCEINPLVITKSNEVIALDARVIVDDNAIFKHPNREKFLSQELRYTSAEKEAKDADLSYVNLGGEIGMLSVGAGLGMATADLIAEFGGSPLNFLDVGGGAGEEKVLKALEIMVKDKGLKSILINAFGGITRLDQVAEGIISARNKLNLQIPLIIRLMGTNQKEGIKILENQGLQAFEEMEPAIQAAVEAAKGVN